MIQANPLPNPNYFPLDSNPPFPNFPSPAFRDASLKQSPSQFHFFLKGNSEKVCFCFALILFGGLFSLFKTMIPNPDLVHYVCIAKGTTLLAELNCNDSTLGATAAKCLENTPPYHAAFSHTVRSKTYSFLMDDSFVYFAIFDENLGKSEGFAFLKRVKDAFGEVFKGEENLTSHCFQEALNPVFRRLLGSAVDWIGPRIGQSHTLPLGSGPFRDRMNSNGESGINKMKNRLPGEVKNGKENGERENGESNGNGIELSSKFPLMLHGNGGFYSAELTGHQRAKKVWKKQVWVVLSLDLIICMMLFGVWLWICRGLKCIEN